MRIAEVVAIAGTGVALFVGQITPSLPALPNLDFGNLTATALLGWYAWHTATRTIPNLVKDFREESKEARTAFKEEMALERSSHRSEVDGIKAAMEKS